MARKDKLFKKSIYRYPLTPPSDGNRLEDNPTQTVDYVMFERNRIVYDDTNQKAYYGLNTASNDVQRKPNRSRVYIAMPKGIATSYTPTYRQVDLGVAGMALAAGMGSTEAEGIAETLQAAAQAALPEFQLGALAQLAQGGAQALGLAGQADANTLLQLTKGKVFNPYTEQMFSNVQFRTHAFNFKMFARNEDESIEIAHIIKYLKQGALPSYGEDDEGKQSKRFFEVPDKFDIKFVRMDPSGRMKSVSEDLHFKIHTSVCTGVDVNYTPDGQYNAVKNSTLGVGSDTPLQVPAVTVNCKFTETKFVTQSEIKEGF